MQSAHLKPLSIVKTEQQFSQPSLKLLTLTQPKIDKNPFPSAILHLSPHNISGRNLCIKAYNCKKLCLHFSGNKLYHDAKFKARQRKSYFFNNSDKFIQCLLINAIHVYSKNDNQLALRLNGTSDIDWLSYKLEIDNALSQFLFHRYNVMFNAGIYSNIFEAFLDAGLKNMNCYDYTKVISKDRIARAKDVDLDLSFSFDGWNNSSNIQDADLSLNNGIRLAACFAHIKKNQPMPKEIRFLNHYLPVVDGDKDDLRYTNPNYCCVGLRFKRPQAFKVSQEYINNFCIDTI